MAIIEPVELRLRFLGEPMGVLADRPDGPLHALALDASFLAKGHELSPLNLPNSLFAGGLREFRPGDTPFSDGLPGLIADSLPDAWGRRMQEAEFPGLQTTIGKLAAIGNRGPGAITYEPTLTGPARDKQQTADLPALARNAEALNKSPGPLGTRYHCGARVQRQPARRRFPENSRPPGPRPRPIASALSRREAEPKAVGNGDFWKLDILAESCCA